MSRHVGKELIQVEISVGQAQRDALLGLLCDLGFPGAEETADGLRVWISATDPASRGRLDSVRDYLSDLREFDPALRFSIEYRTVSDRDWVIAVREAFKPLQVTPRLAIRPSWTEFQTGPDVHTLVIDPGMAFGTGGHETTRLMLRLLDERLAEGGVESVLDLGCGSGVLGIAAALLGAASVAGCDNDPEALSASRENAAANGVTLELADSLECFDRRFDLVLANINHKVLNDLAEAVCERAAGTLLLSGLTHDQVAAVQEQYAARGLVERCRIFENEWVGLRLDRLSNA